MAYAKIFTITSLVFLSLCLVSPVKAGDFVFSFFPNQKTVLVGEEFNVDFVVSATESVNAARAQFTFDEEYLEVINLSTTDSLFTYWPMQPKINGNKIDFSGGLPDPGFIGDDKKILSMLIRAKKAGSAKLQFVSGSMHANDGQGTNVLTSMNGAVFMIQPEGSLPAGLPPEELLATLPAPDISSPTHPDQTFWYRQSKTVFTWQLPHKADTLYYQIDNNPQTYPQKLLLSSLNLSHSFLENGIWYFHLRYEQNGERSRTAHYKIQFDDTPPEEFDIVITKPEGSGIYNLSFPTADALSGIDYYEVKIDDGKYYIRTSQSFYEIASLPAGTHPVIVSAVDKAGNHRLVRALIDVETLTFAPQLLIKMFSPDILPLEMRLSFYYGVMILFFILLLLLFFLWFRRAKRHQDKKFSQEVGELAASVDFGFQTLRRDILLQINEIYSKQKNIGLDDKEKETLKKLEADLDIVETYIKKELKDVSDFDNYK